MKKDKEKKRQTSKPTATGIRGPSGATSSTASDQVHLGSKVEICLSS